MQISISRQVWILGFLRAGFYKLRARLRYIYLSRSDIQIFYGLKVVNGIWQCVNNIKTGILKNKFVVHGQYIRSVYYNNSHFNLSKMVAMLYR